jgi:hypothetical protein
MPDHNARAQQIRAIGRPAEKSTPQISHQFTPSLAHPLRGPFTAPPVFTPGSTTHSTL